MSSILIRHDVDQAGKAPLLEAPDSPYRGLEAFRYVDSPIFFARSKEVRKLLRFVIMFRGTLLYGDSGSGKSSLVNAGLIPAVMNEGLIADRIRVQPTEGQELIVEFTSRTSAGEPRYLPSNFLDDNSESAQPRVVLSVNDLPNKLRALPQSRRPLLIFDQFEELVTLFEEAPRDKGTTETLKIQGAILDVLVSLIRDETLPVKLLFVFREDYLAKLTKFFVRSPDLPDHYLRLTAPPQASLYKIIRGPFETLPGRFENELSQEVTRSLIKEIETSDESGAVNLSEVQIACLELWRSPDPQTLLERRTVAGLLEDFLSEALNSLAPELRDPSVALLRRLVTASGTRNVISEDTLVYLVNKEERIPSARLTSALEALVKDTKLVRRERRQNTIFYQIVSEFLVPWIRLQQAERQGRLQRRRAYRIIAVISAVAVLMGLLSYWIYEYRSEQALKDIYVQAWKETARRANDNEERANEEYLKLREILAGDTSKKEINDLYSQRDELTSQYHSAQKQIKELTKQNSDLEALNERLKDISSTSLAAAQQNWELANKNLLNALKERDDLIAKNKTLIDDKQRLETELRRLKEGPTEPGHSPPHLIPPPAGNEATEDHLWGILPEAVVKHNFGSKVNETFYVFQIVIGNSSDKVLLVQDISFSFQQGKITYPASAVTPQMLETITNGKQLSLLLMLAYRGGLVVPAQQQIRTLVLMPKEIISVPHGKGKLSTPEVVKLVRDVEILSTPMK